MLKRVVRPAQNYVIMCLKKYALNSELCLTKSVYGNTLSATRSLIVLISTHKVLSQNNVPANNCQGNNNYYKQGGLLRSPPAALDSDTFHHIATYLHTCML